MHILLATTLAVAAASAGGSTAGAAEGRIGAGQVLRVSVPEAIGAKTVIGQLTVDHATEPGFVVAYGCGDGLPGSTGGFERSDLNFDGRVTPVASNRLIVQADGAGDVCFFTTRQVDMIVDVNAVSFDVGINSFPNRRTDTRSMNLRPQVAADAVLRVSVPEAVGGKTVFGQLTSDRTTEAGYVTAYGCDDGIPSDSNGVTIRSDLNVDGRVNPVVSNRLVVQADDDGDICFVPTVRTDLIVDVNAVSDVGITSFPNRRTDTRTVKGTPTLGAGGVTRVNVPAAAGALTVIGQLTVDRTSEAGFVTAYGCEDGLPQTPGGGSGRSDLNFDGRVDPVASNRLIVRADRNGDICFATSAPADIIVDINAVSGVGITSFPNRRIDTRSGTTTSQPPGTVAVPEWAPFEPGPPLAGVAALTGAPASETITSRPIVAVKIDNFRVARPQWGLDRADAIIEENVEGVTRFIALFHTRLPAQVGPVRSARTGDLDMLASMNRPIFGYSGANSGVSAWISSAAASGVLVDFTAQRRPCYTRTTERPGPHNLILDAACCRRGGAHEHRCGRAGPPTLDDRPVVDTARRGADHTRQHVPRPHGRSPRGVDLERRQRQVPAITGRPRSRGRVRQQDRGPQRGRDLQSSRAISRRRTIGPPDHRRCRQCGGAPGRPGDRRHLVPTRAARPLLLRGHSHGCAGAARPRHHVHRAQARPLMRQRVELRTTRPLRRIAVRGAGTAPSPTPTCPSRSAPASPA
jgi:hypothetical protein